MNSNLKGTLHRVSANHKKELAIVAFINIIFIGGMIATYVLTHNNLIFIPFIFLIVLVNAVAFYRYLFIYSRNASNKIKELVILLRCLYLDINSQVQVKDALFNLKEKASLKMNQKLEAFFTDIKQDESLLPYLHFATNFSSVLVEEVMINLYRYSKNPHKDNLLHFNEAYLKLKKTVDEDDEHDNNRQYEFIKSTAIIGTAIIVMLVIIVTIIIVEEYIHG